MPRSTTYKQDSKFWIALIDMITSILIVYLLVSFVDTILSPKNIELAIIDKKRNEFIDLLKKQFSRELKTKTIQYDKEFDHLKITFSDKVLFDTGEHDLRYQGRAILNRSARVINSYIGKGGRKSIKTIQVEGHTDSKNLKSKEYPKNNWELSTARAISVIEHFTGQGVASNLFSANGYEANRPISTNDNKNRRIELKIFFSSSIK